LVESIFIAIFLTLITINVVIKKFYRTSVFFLILLGYVATYLIPTIHYQDIGIEKYLLIRFYLLYLIAIFCLIIGFTWRNKNVITKLRSNDSNKNKYFKYLMIALLLKFITFIAADYSGNSVVKALIFIFDDISTILFYGYLYVYFVSGKKLKFFKKSLVIIILFSVFYLKDIINLVNGNEYSRYNLLLVVVVLFLLLMEHTKEKFLLSAIAIISGIIIVLNFGLINQGDFFILKYGTDVLKGLESNFTTYKPFLILYSFGFYMLPDLWGFKPVFYTANGQFMLDILGYSVFQVEQYPFGIGITGVIDAYWNWGIFGIVFFFFCAGLFLKILRNNAIKYNSSFLYGIYILQVCKLFLLFRLDFSFYFGRLIIILPILYLITRRVAVNESKFNKLK
jgi:hypothetical protein